MSCNVCVEEYNKSTRKSVECAKCQFVACRSCYKEYINTLTGPAQCMNCKNNWDLCMMNLYFERKYIDTIYKCKLSEILYNNEKSRLPLTQLKLHDIIHREYITKRLKEIDTAINLKKNELRMSTNTETRYSLREEIQNLLQERPAIHSQFHAINSSNKTTPTYNFIQKCQFDNCNGFLNTDWLCIVCNHTTCKDCHLIVENEHVCNDNDKLTVKLLEKDSKNCPTCAIFIYKIIGCDQMFCTNCHTAFSWTTGQIENGVIHNPHGIEYMAQMGSNRTLGEIQCGRDLDHIFITSLNNVLKKYTTETIRRYIRDIARNVTHLREVSLRDINPNNIIENWNELLRMDFLRNNINETQFKQKLYSNYKIVEKRKSMAEILNTYILCATDILYRLHEDPNLFLTTISECNNLIEYINGCYENLSYVYKQKTAELTEFGAIKYHI